MTLPEPARCPWVPLDKPLYVRYHDEEWGVPVFDGEALFAKLCLDGAQAGLSWWTILQRRENYYRVFDGFEPAKIAGYDEAKIAALLQDPGIIRNRQKVRSVIGNARAYLALVEETGSFSRFLWDFVGGAPQVNAPAAMSDYRATSPEAEAMSKALKKRGFSFVGPTIVYAFMQAVGMVNDHSVDCFRKNRV
ncbi:MAG TPA: DNA-3-methyladenine glycosylase I [Anaerolineales bacterium]|nr:DNA-3-methyladenine glycosylase I [Anaerolineales bacterium]